MRKGVVTGVMNRKNKRRIKWDEEYHRLGEPETTEEIFMKTKWNKHVQKDRQQALDEH